MTHLESLPSIATDAVADASPARQETAWHEVLRDGSHVLVRPIHATDIELERRFIVSLSARSRRFRFLETMQSPSDALLKQLTLINPSTDVAYVATVGEGAQEREVGVARFSARADGHDCEFAVTVTDDWQNKGLGTLLMRRLVNAARARGIVEMHSSDSSDNELMRHFAEHLHLRHKRDPEDAMLVLYSIDLTAGDARLGEQRTASSPLHRDDATVRRV